MCVALMVGKLARIDGIRHNPKRGQCECSGLVAHHREDCLRLDGEDASFRGFRKSGLGVSGGNVTAKPSLISSGSVALKISVTVRKCFCSYAHMQQRVSDDETYQ